MSETSDTRKLATVDVIRKIEPIENADAIERVTVRGWHVVAKKGEFEPDDACVYIEVDSLLPDRPEFEFMRTRNFRVRTIKLRGQISQGIVFPMSILPKSAHQYQIGQDVTEELGIIKWEPQIPASMAGYTKGNFPDFIPKTDEVRVQNCYRILEEYAGTMGYLTEKLDGTSFTAYLRNGEFGVCSRNWEKKDVEECLYWKVAKKYEIEKFLRSLGFDAAVQGEVVGPGIQENKYKLREFELYLFNLYKINDGQYVEYFDFKDLVASFDVFIPIVPFICELKLPSSSDEMVEIAEAQSKLTNIWREGVVFRPYEEIEIMGFGRLSFKAINPKFLLKYSE